MHLEIHRWPGHMCSVTAKCAFWKTSGSLILCYKSQRTTGLTLTVQTFCIHQTYPPRVSCLISLHICLLGCLHFNSVNTLCLKFDIQKSLTRHIFCVLGRIAWASQGKLLVVLITHTHIINIAQESKLP